MLTGVLMAFAVILVLFILMWAGLQVQPKPFPAYNETAGSIKTVPLQKDLPAPVERFYKKMYGDRIPVITSVVITGRARIRPMGPWMPARFRFTHDAGKGYRHYIEATWFGLPFFKINERYLDGKSLFELPIGIEKGPKIEQAANLGMWAELAAAAPSVLLNDTRVQWEATDNKTAKLVVPLGDKETDNFIVRFDSKTGGLKSMEGMRWRDSKSQKKILWTVRTESGPSVGVYDVPAIGTATWKDMNGPWAFFNTETLDYNVDIDTYIRAKGI